jgi:hypothetical protein
VASDQAGCPSLGAHLRRGGTLTAELTSADSFKLTFRDAGVAQLEAALEAAIVSWSSSQIPAQAGWLGIYAVFAKLL